MSSTVEWNGRDWPTGRQGKVLEMIPHLTQKKFHCSQRSLLAANAPANGGELYEAFEVYAVQKKSKIKHNKRENLWLPPSLLAANASANGGELFKAGQNFWGAGMKQSQDFTPDGLNNLGNIHFQPKSAADIGGIWSHNWAGKFFYTASNSGVLKPILFYD